MSRIRPLLTTVIALLLSLGYAASQYAWFHGAAQEYARRVDQPPVRMLALGILVVAVVLALVPDREEEEVKR